MPVPLEPSSTPRNTSLRIGVMLESAQLMDCTCIDLIGNCSKHYIDTMSKLDPRMEPLLEQTREVEWYYLAETLSRTTSLTSSILVQPTTTYDECSRDLDLLIVGGPLPSHRPEAAKKFLQESVGKGRVKDVFTVGLGSLWLASAGVLQGRSATTTRDLLPIARKLHPDVDWIDQRWVQDSNIWTCAGGNAGTDMVATYLLHNFSRDLALNSCRILAVDPDIRGQCYKV